MDFIAKESKINWKSSKHIALSLSRFHLCQPVLCDQLCCQVCIHTNYDQNTNHLSSMYFVADDQLVIFFCLPLWSYNCPKSKNICQESNSFISCYYFPIFLITPLSVLLSINFDFIDNRLNNTFVSCTFVVVNMFILLFLECLTQ